MTAIARKAVAVGKAHVLVLAIAVRGLLEVDVGATAFESCVEEDVLHTGDGA